MAMLYYESSFAHHGTKGMKHGLRLYQYKDGSLTPLGRVHYGLASARYQNKDGSLNQRGQKKRDKEINKTLRREKAEQQRINVEMQKVRAAQKTLDDRTKLEDAKNKLKDQIKENDTKKQQNTPTKTETNNKHVSREIKNISDSELRSMVEDLRTRKRLEDEYRDLTSSKADKVVRWAKETALDLAKESIKNVGRDVATQELKRLAGRVIDSYDPKLGDKKDKDKKE